MIRAPFPMAIVGDGQIQGEVDALPTRRSHGPGHRHLHLGFRYIVGPPGPLLRWRAIHDSVPAGAVQRLFVLRSMRSQSVPPKQPKLVMYEVEYLQPTIPSERLR